MAQRPMTAMLSQTANQTRSVQGTTSATRTRLGRSGPRSRNGCATCKQRRVRCDEARPACGHCLRLQLNCEYVSKHRRRKAPHAQGSGVSGTSTPSQRQRHEHVDLSSWMCGNGSPSTALPGQLDALGWQQTRTTDWAYDLDTSWAGEFSCLFPDIRTTLAPVNAGLPAAAAGCHDLDVEEAVSAQFEGAQASPQQTEAACAPSSFETAATSFRDLARDDTQTLIQLFRQIVQPPAAILIGGFERWRRLQQYLCKLSEQSRAVNSALHCVIETLVTDQLNDRFDQDRSQGARRVLERHTAACSAIRAKLLKHSDVDIKPRTNDALLAAIFLLAWFEVIRDQNSECGLFPRDLADQVLLQKAPWGKHSQQLLSWLNTLDCKATHLGGDNLLSPQALSVVSHYPTQITSSLDQDDGGGRSQDASDCSLSSLSPGSSYQSVLDQALSTEPPAGEVKQMMLHTVLQPALQWYLNTQSFCRRIGANDKHHRSRFTSEDEYEVITACKQLETQLLELWESRPSVMSLNAQQLAQVVTIDLAYRLQEIFSVYLASFWILFVYLHRICWWSLPHSNVAKKALEEVWIHLQRAYGEEVNGHLKKVLHPALLWPLFLFGSESEDVTRRDWAIQQLEALGEAKPVLERENTGDDALPEFKLSAGATRNAQRAAVLLRELIKEQEAANGRVDDRDLSMRLFGCYFSIV